MTREPLHFAIPRPVPPGIWRRVPPAIFPPILGLLGLALAWTTGGAVFGIADGPIAMGGGMVAALAVFAMLAYGVKLARRPGVLADELSILPGRAGVGAGIVAMDLLAAVVGALVSQTTGRILLVAGLVLHAAVLAVLIAVLRRAPPEQRRVSPAWHLHFTGVIVAARAALTVGWPSLAAVLVWPAMASALTIYAISLRQALRGRVPGALRPLLAIHVAPLALVGTVALGLGWTPVGVALAWAALAVVLALAVSARWLLAEGFSPFWGALTFPLAATAGVWAALWRVQPTETHRLIAGLMLVAATLIVIPIAALILRMWAQGRLAVRTNAAIA